MAEVQASEYRAHQQRLQKANIDKLRRIINEGKHRWLDDQYTELEEPQRQGNGQVYNKIRRQRNKLGKFVVP